MQSTYDTNRERLLLMYKAGRAEGEKYTLAKKDDKKTNKR
jgi:hypothetical protein